MTWKSYSRDSQVSQDSQDSVDYRDNLGRNS
jgi:hypothetical protein